MECETGEWGSQEAAGLASASSLAVRIDGLSSSAGLMRVTKHEERLGSGRVS